jgi:hypothetical protein
VKVPWPLKVKWVICQVQTAKMEQAVTSRPPWCPLGHPFSVIWYELVKCEDLPRNICILKENLRQKLLA